MNLERLRTELLQSMEPLTALFLHPDVMLGKQSKLNVNLAMRSHPADGKNVKIPARFSWVHPSPLTDATGYPYILGEANDYKGKYTVTSTYVKLGDLETLGAFRGSLDFSVQESETEAIAPVPITAAHDAEEAQEEPLAVQYEEISEQQQPMEVSSTTKPSWDPFASDFFDDDDDEIMRLEQERLEEANLPQAL